MEAQQQSALVELTKSTLAGTDLPSLMRQAVTLVAHRFAVADSTIWELLPDSGDEGARAVMRVRPDLVEQVPCPGSGDDIDTREDLARWQS